MMKKIKQQIAKIKVRYYCKKVLSYSMYLDDGMIVTNRTYTDFMMQLSKLLQQYNYLVEAGAAKVTPELEEKLMVLLNLLNEKEAMEEARA